MASTYAELPENKEETTLLLDTDHEPTNRDNEHDTIIDTDLELSSEDNEDEPNVKHVKPKGCYESLARTCPFFYKVLISRPGDYSYIKIPLNFVYGCLLGFGLHVAVIRRMIGPEIIIALMGITCPAIVGLFCAFSVQARCVCTLIIPVMTGSRGRSFFWTLIIMVIFTGPLTTIILNAKEVSRSLTCFAEFAQNRSAEVTTLRIQPIYEIMQEIKDQALQSKRTARLVKKLFKPIKYEVTDESEIDVMKNTIDEQDETQENLHRSSDIDKKYPNKDSTSIYEKKEEFRCQEIMGGVESLCVYKMTALYDNCRKDHYALTCSPLRLTFVCKLGKFLDKLILDGISCEGSDAVNQDFGTQFDMAQKSNDELGKDFDVDMQYEVVDGVQPLYLTTSADAARAVDEEIQNTKREFERIIRYIQYISALVFVLVIISAVNYHNKYVTDFKFDNVYLNTRFKWVDARRKNRGYRGLLPMKRHEAAYLVSTHRILLTRDETDKLIQGTIRMGVQVMFLAMIVFVDRLFHNILTVVKKHSYVEYRLNGTHVVSVEVEGVGIMARFLRSMLEVFTKRSDLDSVVNNRECLPDGVVTPEDHLLPISYLLSIIWGLLLLQAYARRLRHVITGFFYRRLEKKRTLCLYNTLLLRRKSFLRFARQEVEEGIYQKILEHDKHSSIGSILWFMKKWSKKKCIICKRKTNENFKHCACTFSYCSECWKDVEKHCLACTMVLDIDNDTDYDLDESDRESVEPLNDGKEPLEPLNDVVDDEEPVLLTDILNTTSSTNKDTNYASSV